MSGSAAREALEVRLDDMERKANMLLEIVNDFRKDEEDCRRARRWAVAADRKSFGSGTHTPGSVPTGIKSDTFFGKRGSRPRSANIWRCGRRRAWTAPATPREMYDAITSGGFKFDAKDDTIALVGLRALLRKRTAFFIKLNNGRYGLTSWYPDMKRRTPGKTAEELDDGGDAGDDNDTDDTGEDDAVAGAAA